MKKIQKENRNVNVRTYLCIYISACVYIYMHSYKGVSVFTLHIFKLQIMRGRLTHKKNEEKKKKKEKKESKACKQ